jgi:16S rRNA (uracil1498-N3)-methyltransferase
MIRLYVNVPLFAGAELDASPDQAHYLGTVMRRSAGEPVCLFNGRDGEWAGRINALSRGKVRLRVAALLRPQAPEPDLWLVFAPLKRDMTDLVVQKATELGVSALLPAFTERTNTVRVNEGRLRAIAIEAAEQSERLLVPVLHPPRKLAGILADWPANRSLFAALERDAVPPPSHVCGPAALLIGPEGGFGPRDRASLARAPFVRPVSLGPRILRAETAAIVGLALLQATTCG